MNNPNPPATTGETCPRCRCNYGSILRRPGDVCGDASDQPGAPHTRCPGILLDDADLTSTGASADYAQGLAAGLDLASAVVTIVLPADDPHRLPLSDDLYALSATINRLADRGPLRDDWRDVLLARIDDLAAAFDREAHK